MIAGTPPIRAKKARYFEDARLRERILPPPDLRRNSITQKADDWSGLLLPPRPDIAEAPSGFASHGASPDDPAGTGHRQQPEL
ncbi:conjugal transfer protein TraG, partial [Acinetobacter baumannii]